MIGAASFGHQYGMANSSFVDVEKSKEILKIASYAGVAKIDTAPNYGNSEQVLGSCGLEKFDLFTKVEVEAWDLGDEETISALRGSLFRLGKSSIAGLTFHSGGSVLRDPDRAKQFIECAKEAGLIQAWGVSVYTPEEALEILDCCTPDYLQAPVSIADRRFLEPRIQDRLKNQRVDLQARSLFLQGVLLSDADRVPSDFSSSASLLQRYRDLSVELGISKTQLALMPVLQRPEVKMVVLGVNEPQHLRGILEAIETGPEVDVQMIPYSSDIELLDPRRWGK